MEHAVALFAEKGFEGTSIRDLSKAAGVNVAMISYYFGSKEKLIEAIIGQKASYMKDKIGELEADKALTEIEKVDLLIDDYVDRIVDGGAFHKFLYKELMDSKREEIQKFIIASFSTNIRNFAAIIEKGTEKGIFRQVDAVLTVVSIIGSISQMINSRNMCNQLLCASEQCEPCGSERLKCRLSAHIKQMIHAHLGMNSSERPAFQTDILG